MSAAWPYCICTPLHLGFSRLLTVTTWFCLQFRDHRSQWALLLLKRIKLLVDTSWTLSSSKALLTWIFPCCSSPAITLNLSPLFEVQEVLLKPAPSVFSKTSSVSQPLTPFLRASATSPITNPDMLPHCADVCSLLGSSQVAQIFRLELWTLCSFPPLTLFFYFFYILLLRIASWHLSSLAGFQSGGSGASESLDARRPAKNATVLRIFSRDAMNISQLEYF